MTARFDTVRVLVVSRPSLVWGAQLRLLVTAPLLRDRGIELTLAVPPGNAFHDRWASAGHDLVTLPDPGRDELREADGRRSGPVTLAGVGARAVGRAMTLARHARRFDVVLSFSRHAHVEAAVAGRLARRPVVVEIVDIVRPGLGRQALRFAARAATVVVANSRATGATVHGAARDLRVIHPGVDVERFAPGAPDPAMRARLGAREGAVVGILGRLDPGKGIELVVEAFADAATSGRHPALASATLAIVGDRGVATEDYVEQLRDRSTARLGERVRFTGRIEDVPGVLRSLDVLVNASEAEPFGRSVLEAQAAGVAVVASAAGGIPEFVDDGRTGMLFPADDAVALADALERVLVDRDLRVRIAAAARTQAVEHFADSAIVDAWASLYRELVA